MSKLVMVLLAMCFFEVGCKELLDPGMPEPMRSVARSPQRQVIDKPRQKTADEAELPAKVKTPEPSILESTFLDELPIGTTFKFMKDVDIPASSSHIEFAYSPHPREDSRGCILFGSLVYKSSSGKRIIRKGFSVQIVSIVPHNPDNPGGDVLRIYVTDGPSELDVRVYRVWNMDGGEANGSCADERRLTASDMQLLTRGMLRVTRIPEAKTF